MGLLSGTAARGNELDDKREQKQWVDARLDDAHDEVLAFNKKVAAATRSVIDARKKLPAAQDNLRRAQAEQARTEAADEQARLELQEAQAEVLRAEQRLAAIEKRLKELRADVGDFARRAYQMGPFADLEMILEAKDPAEFTDRLAAIRSVARSNNASLDRMAENRAEMTYTEQRLVALREVAEKKKSAAAARLAEAQEAARGAAAAKQIVDRLIDQEEAALASAQQHRSDVKAEYERLEAEQARIQREIAEAAARLERSTGVKTNPEVSAPVAGTDSGTEWYFPLPGYSIGSDAGWRFHPILHYTRCHAGADISAPAGTPIHAVAGGTVIQAGWNGGYGNFTTIAHGGGVTSSYAHQTRIIVGVGESVGRGQVIGYVGTTGLSTGPHLHFEARVSAAPYSPKGWFGQGPKVQVCV
jgi:murein DD-endopeptidase MepM/ murein hydrolase activator NlpD